MSKKHIDECVRANLEKYFRDLRRHRTHGMYDMMVRVVEKPDARGGDAQATTTSPGPPRWLGINRNTLRKKLQRTQALK
jgi:Fis family transcriptional regulator